MKIPNYSDSSKKKRGIKRFPKEVLELEKYEFEPQQAQQQSDDDDQPLIQDVEKQIKSKKEIIRTQSKRIKKATTFLKKNAKSGSNICKFSCGGFFGGGGSGGASKAKKKQKLEEQEETDQQSDDNNQLKHFKEDKPCLYKQQKKDPRKRPSSRSRSKREKAEDDDKVSFKDGQTQESYYEDLFKWVEFNDECKEFVPQPLPQFNLVPGIKKPELLVTTDPWAFFSSILRKEFFEQTAYNTNEYSKRFKELAPKCSYLIGWDGTDWKEISAFFGLNYLFGLLCRSQLEEH